MAYQAHAIPENFLSSWQNTANVMADIFDVPAGLIMRVLPEQIEVLVSADRLGNPYEAGDKADLNTGLYCETVMATRSLLEVSNALEYVHWENNPDVALDMISYLGVPLLWPDQEVFGTICVLDKKTRQFSQKYIELLWEIKKSIESDLRLIVQQERLLASNAELTELAMREKDNASQLRAANDKLHQAMHDLLDMQKELLQSKKNAALGSLVAGVSHELNTPIGCCVTAATTLQYRTREFSELMEQSITRNTMRNFVKTVQEGSDILVRNLDRSVKLLESFRRVSIDQAGLSPERFNLSEVVNTVLLSESVQDSGHRFENTIPADITMCSYAGAVGDVVSELVHNAALHAFPQRGRGAVTVSAFVMEDGGIRLRVEDDGAGIKEEHLDRIFDPFFTTTLGQGSSGLGLYTVYKLVTKALHGTIEARSTPGVGTCFTLRLPQLLAGHAKGTDPVRMIQV